MRWFDGGFRVRGQVSMPGRRGRVRTPAGWFGVLELVGSTLTLRMRPSWLWARLANGGGRLVVHADEEAVIFPVRPSTFRERKRAGTEGFGSHGGLGVQPEGRPASYIYVMYFAIEGPRILDAIEDAGFQVSWEERPFEF